MSDRHPEAGDRFSVGSVFRLFPTDRALMLTLATILGGSANGVMGATAWIAAGSRLLPGEAGPFHRALLVVGAVVFGTVWVAATETARPMRTLLSFLTTVANGDLSGRVCVGGRDELAQVAAGITAAVGRFQVR